MQELLLLAVQPLRRADAQAQQLGERQVDLADLVEVEVLTDAAELLDLVLGERCLDLRGQ